MTDAGGTDANRGLLPSRRVVRPGMAISTISALVIGYTSTGGTALQSLLVSLPLAVAFVLGGRIGGLLAICGSLTAYTGVIGVLNAVRPATTINQGVTYVVVTFGIVLLSVLQRSDRHSPSRRRVLHVSWEDAAFLVVALISGYFALRSTRSTDLQFLNSMAGSEDNAAWISGTRTFVAGEMTPGFLAHPTAKSPVTGALLGVVADVHALSERGTPQHLVALRALRTAYALIITMSALAAALWVGRVARRSAVRRSTGFLVVVLVGTVMAGIASQLFVAYGFFSFIAGITVLLTVILGFELVFGDNESEPAAVVPLIVVTCGLAGAWWGVAPLAGCLLLVLISDSKLRAHLRASTSVGTRVIRVVLVCSGVTTLAWTWVMSLGFGIETGHTGSTGTLPIIDTAWILPILLVVGLLVLRGNDSRRLQNARLRAPVLLLAAYVVGVWSISWLKYAEPRYAAWKILALLSIVALVGTGVLLVEHVHRVGSRSVMVALVFLVFWSGVVHESYNGIRGPGLGDTTTSVQAKILDALNRHPGKKIACLHQSDEEKVAAYLCSRLASAFTPGFSPVLDAWQGALLNPDISPNGVLIPRDRHVGTRVLSELGEKASSTALVVVLLGGDRSRGPITDLGPDFWWVTELKWSEIEVEYW